MQEIARKKKASCFTQLLAFPLLTTYNAHVVAWGVWHILQELRNYLPEIILTGQFKDIKKIISKQNSETVSNDAHLQHHNSFHKLLKKEVSRTAEASHTTVPGSQHPW